MLQVLYLCEQSRWMQVASNGDNWRSMGEAWTSGGRLTAEMMMTTTTRTVCVAKLQV